MTRANKEHVALDWVSCIHYPVEFKKDEIRALMDSSSKVNAMTLGYALKLGLKICHTDIRAHKIDSSLLKTFGMVLASFQMENRMGRP